MATHITFSEPRWTPANIRFPEHRGYWEVDLIHEYVPGYLMRLFGVKAATQRTTYACLCEFSSILPDGEEKSTGLRKLLEAKDCFVRAALP